MERVSLDDDLDYVVRSLDLGGHMTRAIEFLRQTVAERNTARAPSARALPGGMVQHPTARAPPARMVAMGAGIAPTTAEADARRIGQARSAWKAAERKFRRR